jgi:hypothetical protein
MRSYETAAGKDVSTEAEDATALGVVTKKAQQTEKI